MRSRLLRQLLLLRDLTQPRSAAHTTIRRFTYNSTSLSVRPQLPFLAIPSRVSGSHQQWRRITTERIKREVGLAIKYTAYFWTMVFFVAVMGFAVQQEFMEQRYPTPHEWSFRSRMLKRGAEAEKGRTDVVQENWVLIVQMLQDVLGRLENPSKDGKGLRDVEGGPPGAKDITAMSEPWRRAYVETLLLCCQASEHVQGFVLDKTRNIVFPQDVVKGPSNPFPKPVPPGSESPPREENCVPSGFPDTDELYVKLLATEGLTSKQRIDATLSYANWLEYKGALAPAAVMYEGALNLAIEEIHTPGAPFFPLDPKTATLNQKAQRKPSANLLAALTALATFKARHEEVAAALPILTSILQARRSLPPTKTQAASDFSFYQPNKSTFQKILDFIKPPDYPPPPPDGTAPPVRDSKELCEEAALHLHIGEILYTLQSSTKEDGLAWTREGVDLAEEELHKVLEQGKEDRVTKKVCRECLASGLANWRTMATRMVKQEDEARASGKKPSAGWFGLWSGAKMDDEDGGRWAAEEKVVGERTRRAQELLEDLQKPRSGLLSGLVQA